MLWKLLKVLSWVKGIFAIGMTIYIIGTFSREFGPLIIRRVIDTTMTAIVNGAGPETSAELLQHLALLILVMGAASLCTYIASRTLMHCANRIAELLRNRAYEVMQRLPISYFDSQPAGKISTRIINDTETLRGQFYGNFLTQVLVTAIRLLIVYSILFYLNAFLAMFLLLLIPVFYLWQKLYQKRTVKQMNVFFESRSEVNTQVNETMNGHTILQLYGQEEKAMRDFEESTERMQQASNHMIQTDAGLSWSLAEVFKRVVLVAVLAVIGSSFLNGAYGITAGLLYVYVDYIGTLFDLMGMFVRQFPNIQRSLETGKRLFELLEEPTESDGTGVLQVTEGAVRFEDVTFAYVADTPVLKHISLSAAPGETVALVGHTGSGKSSIMNLLFRFYDPQSGRIVIDGQDIQQCRRESVREQMGIVLQDAYLFSGTVASNVSMDDEEMSDETIRNALIQVGAQAMIDRLPQGIHEPVVDKGNAFSSGERQLIAFARTLAANPKILILDEATSHIDTETEDIIQQAMAVVKQGRTTFIIAHRLSTIQNADKIIVLNAGEIVESGNHAALMAQNGYYAEMYRAQAQQ